MNHLFRNTLGLIVFCSAIYMLGVWGVYVVDSRLDLDRAASASVAETVTSPLPRLKSGAQSELVLNATSFLSAYLSPDGRTEILVEKNASAQAPIASITKLMTALVAIHDFDLGATTTLANGRTFTVDSLLNSMLVESNNKSAEILSRLNNEVGFVSQMNQLAESLGMAATYYANPSGLDEPGRLNFSSASDLFILTEKILKDDPQILAITRQPSATIYDVSGQEDHVARTTNVFLENNPWPADIVGGKTGSTDLAKTNLVLILKDHQSGGHLINIILGSDDNFGEMTKLVNWIYQNYEF